MGRPYTSDFQDFFARLNPKRPSPAKENGGLLPEASVSDDQVFYKIGLEGLGQGDQGGLSLVVILAEAARIARCHAKAHHLGR